MRQDDDQRRLGFSDPTGELRRLEALLGEVDQSMQALHRDVISDTEVGNAIDQLAPSPVTTKVAFLRELLAEPRPEVVPELDPHAPLGHGYPLLERKLGLRTGEGRQILEELADLGLLDRTVHNRVHACPQCERCQINFRETCPSCGGIDSHIERLVHHFACAHIGLESEFDDGIEMACPKCRERLFQLGQDFERPHETYVCKGCDHLFESPRVATQCLHCAHEFPSREARMIDIHRYHPTELAPRAVELGRLTSLQVSELLFDPAARLARADYLLLEARREFLRLDRHGCPLSLARLRFTSAGRSFALFRSGMTARAIEDLGRKVTSSLRELDLAAPTDPATLTLLLPETSEEGARAVAERIDGALQDLALRTEEGAPLEVAWEFVCWAEAPNDLDAALRLVAGDDALEGPQ